LTMFFDFSSDFVLSAAAVVYFVHMAYLDETHPLVVFTDTGELDPTPAIEYLALNGWHARIAPGTAQEEIVSVAQNAEALIVGYASVTSTLLDALPRLRVIATMSAGYDQVDLTAAKGRNVAVFNLPGAATEEVATHALAMALALVRELPRANVLVRDGGWTDRLQPVGKRPSTLKVGVIGLGRIGACFARLARPLFGEVVGIDPGIPPECVPPDIRTVEFEELISTANVISLHSAWQLTDGPILNSQSLDKIQDGTIVINTSRGAAIDMVALVNGLETGKLAGVGLDVFPEEPLSPASPILRFPNAILSPHSAYLSPDSQRAYVLGPAHLIVSWAQGRATQPPVV